MAYTNFTISITQSTTGTNPYYSALSSIIGAGNIFVVKNVVLSAEILTGTGILFDFGISATNNGNPSLWGRYIAPSTELANNEFVNLQSNIMGKTLLSTDYLYVNLNTTGTNILKIIVSGLLLPITHPFYGTTFNFSNTTAARLTVPGNDYAEIVIGLIDPILVKSVFLTNDDETSSLPVGLFLQTGSTKYLLSSGVFDGKGCLLLSNINNIAFNTSNDFYLGSLSATPLNVTYSVIANEVI